MTIAPEELEAQGLPPLGAMLGGRYRLDAVLGKGGVGVVYRALDAGASRPVAVKVLPKRLDEGVVRKRFEREATLAASLDHPHIVAIHDSGFTDADQPFLVMELLHGESLAERIQRVGALSVRRCAEIAYQLLDALESAHAREVLHRDLKPANVFLEWGPHAHVKLIDFGVARDMGGDLTQITEPGLAVGTPIYMAPEIVMGKPADVRTDLYGVGATLFETLTGVVLVERDKHVHKVFRAILQLVPPVPGELRPDGDGRLDAIVLRALAKEPAARYPSASAMREDVERLLDGLGDSDAE